MILNVSLGLYFHFLAGDQQSIKWQTVNLFEVVLEPVHFNRLHMFACNL